MTILTFTLILILAAYLAGLLGSLTGLGGGVVVIPVLTLGFGIDFHYAIGAALIASISTSSGSASAYVREGITNIRLGMFLEIATTIGAVLGAFIAIWMPTNIIAVIFGIVMMMTAVLQQRRKTDHYNVIGSTMAKKLKLYGTYPTKEGIKSYELTNVGGGFSIMVSAGILSGLLGIGSGVLKVLAMDTAMKVPFKVSTTTSNFMIGVTAVASAVVYLQRGYIDPGIAFPIIIGVLCGSLTGAKLLKRLNVNILRKVFSIAIVLVALNMIYNGIIGKF
ncbi:sulfite exporter TauE/SafE family protein [Prevotella amnii]|uniref:sulfite exporter TauE/SafE family protein n=1 Tax=Prevotella amnii TaxID=419005 RepID=UPI003369CA9C